MDIAAPNAAEQAQDDHENAMVACLLKHRRTAQGALAINELAGILGCSAKTARRHLAATAEQMSRAQLELLSRACLYAESLVSVGAYKISGFFEIQAYDESPLRVRVAWDSSGSAPNQLAKVFVAHTQWILLLQKVPTNASEDLEFLMLHGLMSPSVRAGDSTSAEGIAAVVSQFPRPALLAKQVMDNPWIVRVSETDGAAANMKCERLITLAEKNTSLQLLCMAHRIHSIADRVFELDASTLSGVIHSLLSMQPANQMLAIETALMTLVEQKLHIDHSTQMLGEDAIHFRQAILTCFLPKRKYPRKRCVCLLLCALLNGDWRQQDRVLHICKPGCCHNKAETLSKIKDVMHRALRSLRPSKMCRANWQDWHRPMNVLGLIGNMHHLLGDAFEMALTKTPPQPVSEDTLGVANSRIPNQRSFGNIVGSEVLTAQRFPSLGPRTCVVSRLHFCGNKHIIELSFCIGTKYLIWKQWTP